MRYSDTEEHWTVPGGSLVEYEYLLVVGGL